MHDFAATDLGGGIPVEGINVPQDESADNARTQIKGRNPHFFDDPNIDRLLTMIMELSSEESVMRDRLDTHERLAARKGLLQKTMLNPFGHRRKKLQPGKHGVAAFSIAS